MGNNTLVDLIFMYRYMDYTQKNTPVKTEKREVKEEMSTEMCIQDTATCNLDCLSRRRAIGTRVLPNLMERMMHLIRWTTELLTIKDNKRSIQPVPTSKSTTEEKILPTTTSTRAALVMTKMMMALSWSYTDDNMQTHQRQNHQLQSVMAQLSKNLR